MSIGNFRALCHTSTSARLPCRSATAFSPLRLANPAIQPCCHCSSALPTWLSWPLCAHRSSVYLPLPRHIRRSFTSSPRAASSSIITPGRPPTLLRSALLIAPHFVQSAPATPRPSRTSASSAMLYPWLNKHIVHRSSVHVSAFRSTYKPTSLAFPHRPCSPDNQGRSASLTA